jgi:hypothetical protein
MRPAGWRQRPDGLTGKLIERRVRPYHWPVRALDDQVAVADRLRARGRTAVGVLVRALDRADWGRHGELLAGIAAREVYQASLSVVMRLVFLKAAEERGLLPLGDPLYDLYYAVSTLRDRLRDAADLDGEAVLAGRYDAWARLLATFRAVYGGAEHEALRLPAYGGGLFDPDRFPFLEGRPAGTSWRDTPVQPLEITNRTVLHLLEALQMRPVRAPGGEIEAEGLSFGALDVEQIGHVYEGLLDLTARRAERPLVVPRAPGGRDRQSGEPAVVPAGSLYVGAGPGRRRSGTHYTPRALTEPIVRYALEPLVYHGPATGLPPEQWTLRSPRELLDLSICDPAMGSGAFLVQACRYLAERLVEAWEIAEARSQESGLSRGTREVRSPERLALARRLVAERCLYGVDKDPTAVEIARLSLWLTVGDRDRPITFLDRALKAGDSLVGTVDPDQAWPVRPKPGTGRTRTRPADLVEVVPFHWPLAFPEVFARENGGFDAIVGNPPFMGGQKISGALGTAYRDYLVEQVAGGARGSADLAAYFVLRAARLLRTGGSFGLVTTNTIAQGDTREVGLDQIVREGFVIMRALPSRKWPGEASLEVAQLWVGRGPWRGLHVLEDRVVSTIDPSLTAPGKVAGPPKRLAANDGQAFIGSYVLGLGFTMSPGDARALIEREPRNAEALLPYINGEDLNARSDQSGSRWIINFRDWPLERAERYPELLDIVRTRVKPERDLTPRKPRRERWWQFAERALGLYHAIRGAERVLVTPLTSKYVQFVFLPPSMVYDQTLVVFALPDDRLFGVLQSSLHVVWVLSRGSTLETRSRYIPTDCFLTFPFPTSLASLEDVGERYYAHRQSIMAARREGLTKTYNRVHDPGERDGEIRRLRELRTELDRAVAEAYGWSDLRLEHGFHQTTQGLRFTISEAARREVLERLLGLNHRRYEAEAAAGLHDNVRG